MVLGLKFWKKRLQKFELLMATKAVCTENKLLFSHLDTKVLIFCKSRVRDCRSTSAKPAVRRSPQQRTSQVHLAEVRDSSDTSNSYTNS